MSKVGSSSVAKSLKASKELAVFQVHNLRSSDIDASLRSHVHKTQRVYSKVIWESIYLNKRLTQNKGPEPWHVITLIREPIARNVSSYFQNIELWCPEICEAGLSESEKLEKATVAFFDKFPHDLTSRWLDNKLRPVIDIDVYKKPFPVDKGYEIYESKRFRLLLIRLESLKDCYAPAFQAFLGISDIPLLSGNIGEEKRYAELYRNFLRETTFPPSYIESMYSSKYMRHFYTNEEIAAYRKRWCTKNC